MSPEPEQIPILCCFSVIATPLNSVAVRQTSPNGRVTSTTESIRSGPGQDPLATRVRRVGSAMSRS